MNKLAGVYAKIVEGFMFGIVDEYHIGTDERNGLKVERFTVKSGERIVAVSNIERNMWVRIQRIDDPKTLYRLNNVTSGDENIIDGIREAMK